MHAHKRRHGDMDMPIQLFVSASIRLAGDSLVNLAKVLLLLRTPPTSRGSAAKTRRR